MIFYKSICKKEPIASLDYIFFINFFKKSKVLICLFMLIILIVPSSMAFSEQDAINKNTFCNCVIFRLDDIQEGSLESTQIDLLNLFLSKNESLSLGLIMNSINDTQSALIKKIMYGLQKSLFDLALHGLHHVDYTQLTGAEQKASLEEANKKIQKIFGEESLTFIPPYNSFNTDTLYAMNQSHIKIISSMTNMDENPIFIANGRETQYAAPYGIYHMPEMTSFENYTDNDQVIINPINKILNDIYYDIPRYGYSVITLHPQGFAKNVNGNSDSVTDTNQIKKLSSIIDNLKSKNISSTTFSKMIGKEGYHTQPIA